MAPHLGGEVLREPRRRAIASWHLSRFAREAIASVQAQRPPFVARRARPTVLPAAVLFRGARRLPAILRTMPVYSRRSRFLAAAASGRSGSVRFAKSTRGANVWRADEDPLRCSAPSASADKRFRKLCRHPAPCCSPAPFPACARCLAPPGPPAAAVLLARGDDRLRDCGTMTHVNFLGSRRLVVCPRGLDAAPGPAYSKRPWLTPPDGALTPGEEGQPASTPSRSSSPWGYGVVTAPSPAGPLNKHVAIKIAPSRACSPHPALVAPLRARKPRSAGPAEPATPLPPVIDVRRATGQGGPSLVPWSFSGSRTLPRRGARQTGAAARSGEGVPKLGPYTACRAMGRGPERGIVHRESSSPRNRFLAEEDGPRVRQGSSTSESPNSRTLRARSGDDDASERWVTPLYMSAGAGFGRTSKFACRTEHLVHLGVSAY